MEPVVRLGSKSRVPGQGSLNTTPRSNENQMFKVFPSASAVYFDWPGMSEDAASRLRGGGEGRSTSPSPSPSPGLER